MPQVKAWGTFISDAQFQIHYSGNQSVGFIDIVAYYVLNMKDERLDLSLRKKGIEPVVLLSPRQVASALAVSRATVVNWAKKDRIPYVRLPGGILRIPLEALNDSLEGTHNARDRLYFSAGLPVPDSETK